MDLYKLIDGALVSAPESIEIDGCWHTPATEQDLKSEGYKPLKTAERPPTEWYEKHVISYTESEEAINEVVTIAPSDSIRGQYSNDILNELNRALENDFIWSGHVVKLSKENQGDYDACEARLNKNPELIPLVHYTFKDKTIKYFMADLAEVTDFSKASFLFVCECLTKYRDEELKVSLMSDSELYDYVKAL